MVRQSGNHLEALLIMLATASGEDALESRKRVFNYARFTDDNLVVRQVKQIRQIRLLRQFLGVGVSGQINRAVNARLAELGG